MPGGNPAASAFILAATSWAVASALAPGDWKIASPAAGVPFNVKTWP
jgi:hypothetical protein